MLFHTCFCLVVFVWLFLFFARLRPCMCKVCLRHFSDTTPAGCSSLLRTCSLSHVVSVQVTSHRRSPSTLQFGHHHQDLLLRPLRPHRHRVSWSRVYRLTMRHFVTGTVTLVPVALRNTRQSEATPDILIVSPPHRYDEHTYRSRQGNHQPLLCLWILCESR